MQNLLSIERSFLAQPEIKAALRLSEISTLQRNITNAKKKKFEQSLALSKHVEAAFQWFSSSEAKQKLAEDGISWTVEDFSKKVFGWQKSFFYKMVKAAKLPEETITQYNQAAEQAGEDAARSIEELLSYAKQVEQGTQDGGQCETAQATETAQIIVKLEFIHPDGKIKITIDENNQIKIKGGNDAAHATALFQQAIQFINDANNQ